MFICVRCGTLLPEDALTSGYYLTVHRSWVNYFIGVSLCCISFILTSKWINTWNESRSLVDKMMHQIKLESCTSHHCIVLPLNINTVQCVPYEQSLTFWQHTMSLWRLNDLLSWTSASNGRLTSPLLCINCRGQIHHNTVFIRHSSFGNNCHGFHTMLQISKHFCLIRFRAIAQFVVQL